jgi:hypothetical protein
VDDSRSKPIVAEKPAAAVKSSGKESDVHEIVTDLVTQYLRCPPRISFIFFC